MNTDRKKYFKMMKKYKKELKQIAKDSNPWDYGHIKHFIITSLKFMSDYYELGYNVQAIDDNRLKTLRETLDIYDKIDQLENKYYIWELDNISDEKYKTISKNIHQEAIQHYNDLPKDKKASRNIFGIETDIWTKRYPLHTLLPDPVENCQAYEKERKELNKQFWESICKNLETWWD